LNASICYRCEDVDDKSSGEEKNKVYLEKIEVYMLKRRLWKQIEDMRCIMGRF
jgi:hypothetical protein